MGRRDWIASEYGFWLEGGWLGGGGRRGKARRGERERRTNELTMLCCFFLCRQFRTAVDNQMYSMPFFSS